MFRFCFLFSFLNFQLVDFGLDLGFEFVGGALEFVERFSDLAGNFWQPFRAEDQKGQDEDERRVAETHVLNHSGAVGGRQREWQGERDENFRVDFPGQNAYRFFAFGGGFS